MYSYCPDSLLDRLFVVVVVKAQLPEGWQLPLHLLFIATYECLSIWPAQLIGDSYQILHSLPSGDS